MSGTISAGWGYASHAMAEDLVVALEAALRAYGVPRPALIQVAIPAGRPDGAALVAANRLRLPLFTIARTALTVKELELASNSARSVAATGSPSASEAAALCVAGPGAVLLGPRIAVGPVTCALARRK